MSCIDCGVKLSLSRNILPRPSQTIIYNFCMNNYYLIICIRNYSCWHHNTVETKREPHNAKTVHFGDSKLHDWLNESHMCSEFCRYVALVFPYGKGSDWGPLDAWCTLIELDILLLPNWMKYNRTNNFLLILSKTEFHLAYNKNKCQCSQQVNEHSPRIHRWSRKETSLDIFNGAPENQHRIIN